MGLDWVESSPLARGMAVQADQILGFPLSEIMAEGPDEELMRTSRCQPALYLHGLMALALIYERLPNLRAVGAAGLSLGEFTAHAAAGSFSFETGLRLVARRGELMEEACQANGGAMAAMIGGEEDQVRALAKEAGADIANFNAPGQIVISGTNAAIDRAIEQAKAFGIRRAIKLNVAGAYHSHLMQSAQDKLADELAAIDIQTPSIPVTCNFAASAVTDPAEIRMMLEKQVTGSVRWTESIQNLVKSGHTTFLELGPGKVIAGLISKIEKSAVVHSVEDLPTLEAAVEALG